MKIEDDVMLANELKDKIVFRWHLSTSDKVNIAGKNGKYRIKWKDAIIYLNASNNIDLTQEMLPNSTLGKPEEDWTKEHKHTCIVI
ncbi:MAG: hypothetical protein SNJ70_05115 [Armatimonadota bacterium]